MDSHHPLKLQKAEETVVMTVELEMERKDQTDIDISRMV